MGLARLRTADAGRKTRGPGNASFRSAAIRLWRATLIVGSVGYNCTEVSIWFGAGSVLGCRAGRRETSVQPYQQRTPVQPRERRAKAALPCVRTIPAVAATRHRSRKMYTLLQIRMAVRE